MQVTSMRLGISSPLFGTVHFMHLTGAGIYPSIQFTALPHGQNTL